MIVASFILSLILTVSITNDAAATDEVLEFEKSDSMIIFGCLISSIIFQFILPKIPIIQQHKFVVAAVFFGVYLCTLIIVNINREHKIQQKHEQIQKVFQSLIDIFGAIQPEDIDFGNVPFKFDEDPKLHVINSIIIDTTVPGLKINDNSIIYAQYSLNKYFPEFQWTGNHDAPHRQLIYKGLPKPPKLAKWMGSDYRPSGWIPVGLAGGNKEVCLNIADQKDYGMSSYVNEDGVEAGTLEMPSAPQVMVLGSTGGGKSIFIDQEIF